MTAVENLPGRPLRFDEMDHLDEGDADVAPFSVVPEADLVFAVVFITDRWIYGLGFDEDRSEWVVVEKAEIPESRENESESWDRVDTGINEWIEKKYGERYGNAVWEI